MRLIETVLLSTFLVLGLNSSLNASDLVYHLNPETGELLPISLEHAPVKKTQLEKPNNDKNFKLLSVQPSNEILASIEKTAAKYFNSPALQAANLSSLEWLALFRANIEIESQYDPQAESKDGAYGLGQLMPDTAAELGVNSHIIDENLDGSARYLLSLLNKFGSPDLAIAAYNSGSQPIIKFRDIPPFKETREHVRKVLRTFFQLRKYYQGEYAIASE